METIRMIIRAVKEWVEWGNTIEEDRRVWREMYFHIFGGDL